MDKKTYKQFILEREYDVFNDLFINEMSNLFKNETRLPVLIFISTGIGVKHGPRIKVLTTYSNTWTGNTFSVTIDSEPRVIGNTGEIKNSDIEEIVDWVKLNRDGLIDVWKEKISPTYFTNHLKYLK